MSQVLKDHKIFYSISEVAKITHIPSHVLRYWEKEFKHLAPEKSASGQRRYRRINIDMMEEIKKLLYEDGYTIAGAKKKLSEKKKITKQLAFDLKQNDIENLILFFKRQLKSVLEIVKKDAEK